VQVASSPLTNPHTRTHHNAMTSRWRMDFAEGAKRDLPNPLGFNTASAELVRPVTLPYAARHPRAADCPFYVQVEWSACVSTRRTSTCPKP
jgi:hypothetical protein